jgi:hypothetical protein
MPLGAQLCPWGLFYAPQGPSARPPSSMHAPPLSVWALASFKPLEALICPLGSHLCPLGLNYAPWGSFMPPRDQVCTPARRARPPTLGVYAPLGMHAPPSPRDAKMDDLR